MKCSFIPYEGNDPYIFISYSHKDTDRVFPVLDQLNNRGFRVWYDEGIEWGSEWPESIGAHLHNCTVCMLFHSESSVASLNCRQEINYALKERKSVLSIYLEDVQLTYGLDMQLSSFQSTFLYQYDDPDKFYENLFKIKILKTCQKKNVDNKKTILSDGSTYSGDLSDGKQHGKGKLILASGNIYEGDFVNGKRTGKGNFTWTNGEVYEGDFLDGKRTGKG